MWSMNMCPWWQVNGGTDTFVFPSLHNDIAISKRNFTRRFKEATGITQIEYIQRKKFETAKKELENTSVTVDGIADKLGYKDTGQF